METRNYFKRIKRFCCFRSLLAIPIILLFFSKVEGQKTSMPESTFKGGSYEQTFSTGRLGLAQTVINVPKEEFHLVVQHRFYEITSNINDFFGMDYAYTRLGFDYGVFNWLSATIGRNMTVKSYEFALKAVMLKQSQNEMPVSLSWYGSALENTSQYSDTLGHDSFGGRLSYVNQLNIARNQGILSFQVSPLWLHINYDRTLAGPQDIVAVDLATRVRLTEMLAVFAEYIPIITQQESTNTNPFTIGLDINTGHHQFQLIFSNSQGTDENSFLTGTEGSWAKGHIYFGFNLTRVFNSKTD